MKSKSPGQGWVSPSNASQTQLLAIANNATLEQIVTGLTPGCTYYLVVRAVFRPGYSKTGSLAVLCDATELMPKTVMPPSAINTTPDVYGPYEAKAKRASHKVKIVWYPHPDDPGNFCLIESVELTSAKPL